MKKAFETKIMAMFAGAALLMAGYFIGSGQQAQVAHAQQANQAADNRGAIGVSIPNGGAAVVRGKDGFAYVVKDNGMFIRASKSGKHLELD